MFTRWPCTKKIVIRPSPVAAKNCSIDERCQLWPGDIRLADQQAFWASLKGPQGTRQVLMNHKSSARKAEGDPASADELPSAVRAAADCKNWRRWNVIQQELLLFGMCA